MQSSYGWFFISPFLLLLPKIIIREKRESGFYTKFKSGFFFNLKMDILIIDPNTKYDPQQSGVLIQNQTVKALLFLLWI